MSDLDRVSQVERIKQLSSDYEAQKSKSVFLAGVGAAAAVVAASALVFYAWSYFEAGSVVGAQIAAIEKRLNTQDALIASIERETSIPCKPEGDYQCTGVCASHDPRKNLTRVFRDNNVLKMENEGNQTATAMEVNARNLNVRDWGGGPTKGGTDILLIGPGPNQCTALHFSGDGQPNTVWVKR